MQVSKLLEVRCNLSIFYFSQFHWNRQKRQCGFLPNPIAHHDFLNLAGRKVVCPLGGLRERDTAWHSKPETRENAPPQDDAAEARQRAHGWASEEPLHC